MKSEDVQQLLDHKGTAASVAGGTVAVSVAGISQSLEPTLAAIGTVIGIVLSSVLIYANIKKIKRDNELHRLRMANERALLHNRRASDANHSDKTTKR